MTEMIKKSHKRGTRAEVSRKAIIIMSIIVAIVVIAAVWSFLAASNNAKQGSPDKTGGEVAVNVQPSSANTSPSTAGTNNLPPP